MWALDGIFFHVFFVAHGMIRQGKGEAVGIVGSAVPRMICQGRSEAVAYVGLSCRGSLLSLR